VDPSTQSPVWSTRNAFPDMDAESLVDAKLDVTVWNFASSSKQQCLGEYNSTCMFMYAVHSMYEAEQSLYADNAFSV
jgi:hypothetical protein